MEMNRRTFLKTSAAAAVAVSMTGLLGGCSSNDPDTNLGGFTARVGKWYVRPYDEGIGTDLSWYADFKVSVSAHNLDSQNPIYVPGDGIFVLEINGQRIKLLPGGLLNNTTLVLSKDERKEDFLTFRLTDKQHDLYDAMKAKTATVKLTVGLSRHETYTGSYDGYVFVKDTTV